MGVQDSSFEQEERNGKERRDFECFRSITLGYDAGIIHRFFQLSLPMIPVLKKILDAV